VGTLAAHLALGFTTFRLRVHHQYSKGRRVAGKLLFVKLISVNLVLFFLFSADAKTEQDILSHLTIPLI
jgi:hypothetical protein